MAVLMVNPPSAQASRHPDAAANIRAPLSDGMVRWRSSANCLNATLRRVLGEVAATLSPVTVNSTCRSARHNAAVGGAPRSYHLGGHAVDFRVNGKVGPVLAFLRSQKPVGGLKHYADGHIHIDTGPRRTW
jgi:uncharacterized protein YcbK (DUF882 family)